MSAEQVEPGWPVRREQTEAARDAARPDVILCPGGPMLLRGDHVVTDDQGRSHRTTRPVSAVCRCGKSAIKPWCDGTHKVLPRKARP